MKLLMRLHRRPATETGRFVLINPLHVVAIVPDLTGNGAEVLTSPGIVYSVTEGAEAIEAEALALIAQMRD